MQLNRGLGGIDPPKRQPQSKLCTGQRGRGIANPVEAYGGHGRCAGEGNNLAHQLWNQSQH